jgi:predicted ATPase/DNA-binding CsgD family transcriptional regulator
VRENVEVEVSAREAEVLTAVGANLTNTEIAAKLFISVRTVESHVSSLLRKLDAPDRRALARIAARSTGPGRSLGGAPVSFTSFVGRRAEGEQLREALAGFRLVTLVGPGGIGKTRLAVEVGQMKAADLDAWFVDLVPVGPEWVLQAVAAALGLADRPNQTLEEVIQGALALAGRPGLIVLDNCEHVLDAVGAFVGWLLRSSPAVTVLATSREPIGIPGEHVVGLGPLALTAGDGGPAEAAVLFADRAASAGATVRPADGQVADLCARLDGIPLAIELAAVRCASLGVDGVHAGLADRMALLSGSRDADARHRSLRATLDWSCGLLANDEQELLDQLAVFAEWFHPSDATEVAGRDDVGSVGLELGRLAAKSLLVRRDKPEGSAFRMLETVRAYVLDRLVAAGGLGPAIDRHLRWAASQADALEHRLVLAVDWRVGFDRVIDDLRTAIGRTGAEPELRRVAHGLARRLAHLCYARNYLAEAYGHYRKAAELAAGDAEAADDLLSAGHAAFGYGYGDLGFEAYRAAARRAEAAGSTSTSAMALALAAGRARRFRGEFRCSVGLEDLEELYEQAAAFGAGTDPVVDAYLACARAWLDGPDFAEAEQAASEEAVNRARSIQDPVLLSDALDALGSASSAQGRVAEAARLTLERVELLDRLPAHDPRNGSEQLDIRHMATDSPLAGGDPATAIVYGQRFAEDAFGRGIVHVAQHGLVVAHVLLGDFDVALSEADSMREAWRRTGQPPARWMAPAAIAVAMVHALRGDAIARADWDAYALELAPDGHVDFHHFTRARIALHHGRLDEATALLALPHDQRGRWLIYLRALGADVAAASRADGADERIAAVRASFDSHPWAEAVLLRAEARLRQSPDLFARAARAFAALGARFEWACTAILAGHGNADKARTVLAQLGCEASD